MIRIKNGLNENLGNNQSYEGLLQVTKEVKRNSSSEKKKAEKIIMDRHLSIEKWPDIHYDCSLSMICLSTDATLTSQKIVFLYCTAMIYN